MTTLMRAATASLIVLALTGCAPTDDVLPSSGVVDYQLGGAYNPAPGVTGVVRDSTDSPADGLVSIC